MYFVKERIKKITEELRKYVYSDSEYITSFKMKQGKFKGGELEDLDNTSWDSFPSKSMWGGKDKYYWFRVDVEIPARFQGQTVAFEVATGKEGDWNATNPQFLIFIDGKLMQGMDTCHRDIILTEKAVEGEVFKIALHAHSGMNGGLVSLDARIAILDRAVQNLYYNLNVPLEVADLLDKEDKRSIDILKYLNEAINMLDLRKPLSRDFHNSVERANEFLEHEFYGKYCGHEDITAWCVGHSHLDVAWLWTLSETRQKAARTFSTVVNLMKKFPEYIFMSSQPQLYKYVKEEYPELYSQIKEMITEGRWEPEGAMWLEADCNIPSGESLVRQILFGTRFFEKEFGVKNRILWLPDVFGFSPVLPQIMKKSGIDYFMTTKMSWNEYNKIPYDAFMWQGIDGSEVLAYFITSMEYRKPGIFHNQTDYNGDIYPSYIMGAWDRFQQKDLSSEVLVSFGMGDGGGGPYKETLEKARRLEKGIPGCPKVKIGKSLDFFRNLENNVSGNKKLPKWVGELYLELCRGTYTSMARNKKYNRKSEFLYQDAELLCVMGRTAAALKEYPQEELNQGWETILLNQFHDILPGSSIKEVYDDSQEQYLEVLNQGKEIVDTAINEITLKINLNTMSVVVFNQLSFDRSDIIEFILPEGFDNVIIRDSEGNIVQSQLIDAPKVLFFAQDVPSKGYKAFSLEKAPSSGSGAVCGNGIDIENRIISNKFFHIRFDENFNMVSIFDKLNNREVLKPGERGNVLQAFEDMPYEFDAWDIKVYYQEKMWEINTVESAEVLENGPVRATLRINRSFMDSTISQDIQIYNDIPRIDFSTRIDWKEKQILLKAAFPVDIHSEKATYEIQYGNIERPTHWNTGWDFAKFEVYAHKWADLSEDGYGVSLLNDCKYGYDIKDSVMRLTLLKSAVDPNIDADREMHEFIYSLYPHAGNWKNAGTISSAYSLNCPMYAKVAGAQAGEMTEEFSLIRTNCENVMIEVAKKAEDSDDIIVRLYECYNRRSSVQVIFHRDLLNVWECDLLENNQTELPVNGNVFEFDIRPYEIKTFKLGMMKGD